MGLPRPTPSKHANYSPTASRIRMATSSKVEAKNTLAAWGSRWSTERILPSNVGPSVTWKTRKVEAVASPQR